MQPSSCPLRRTPREGSVPSETVWPHSVGIPERTAAKAAWLQSRDVSSGRFYSLLHVRFGAAFANSVSLVSEAMFNVTKVFNE